MIIELPFPPMDLFPNRAQGHHWGKLYKIKSDYRDACTWIAKSQKKEWKHDGNEIHLRLTYVMPDKRMRDADNCLAASKAALDGLSDALMVNDKLFQPIEIRREFGTKAIAKLIVEIKE